MTDSDWVAALLLITGAAAAINRSVAWRKYQERRRQEQVKRLMDLDRKLSREPREE